jgi:hypothetical protein
VFHDASETEQGIGPFFKNISFGVHTALSKTDPSLLKEADRIIKRDAYKGIDAALKHERMKMGTQIVSYLSGSGPQSDHDIPQLTPFDRTREPCSDAEFERLLKNIQRNYPKYKGKCAELLYFLLEIGQLRLVNNITDQQLRRLLNNRFEDRLLTYFMSETKRGRDLLDVVNQIALDYVKTVNPSHEVERYLSFTFKFDNLADELTDLKTAISLAHPRKSYEVIQQMYFDKVLSLLPYEQRQDLLDDINKRDEMIELNYVSRPYTEHELDNRILFHCRSLDRKNTERRRERRIHQVDTRPVSPQWDPPPTPQPTPSHTPIDAMFQVVSELKSLTHNIKKVSDQNAHQIAHYINERKQNTFQQQQQQHQIRPPFPHQPRQHHPQNPPHEQSRHQQRYQPPHQQQQQQQQQNSSDTRYRSNDRPRPPFQTPPNTNTPPEDRTTQLFLLDDPRFPEMVDEIKNHHNFRYIGQKISNDIFATPPKMKEQLREMRANRRTEANPYQWKDGKYLVHQNEQINFPILRKRPTGPPDLTREALEHFAKRCYACGKVGCHGRGHPQSVCPYKAKPDSWLVCTNCKMGFHLAKDCLAYVVEN